MTTGEEWRSYLDVAARFHHYSPNNMLLIWMQRPDATRVAGYKAWQELGRQVRKGEKALRIFAPSIRRCRECEGSGGSTGNPCAACQAHGRTMRFRVVNVFDLAQTDGDPLPEHPARLLTGDDPTGAWDAIVGLIEAEGATVTRGPLLDGANGRTHWADPVSVVVRDDVSGAQAVKTLTHELAHVLMHRPTMPERPGSRGLVEVEAESVAYIVMNTFGLDTADYSLGYVAGWSGGDGALIRTTAERVVKAAAGIIAQLDETRAPAPAAVAQAA